MPRPSGGAVVDRAHAWAEAAIDSDPVMRDQEGVSPELQDIIKSAIAAGFVTGYWAGQDDAIGHRKERK